MMMLYRFLKKCIIILTQKELNFFIGNMTGYLQSDDSLMEQTAILKAALCPEADDPARCEAAMDTYWSQIGKNSFFLKRL